MWTPELKERVKSLWEKHSASQIAAMLAEDGHHHTLNSVVGIIHRMGLSLSEEKTKERQRQAAVRKAINNMKREHRPRLRIVKATGNSPRLKIITSIETQQYRLRCVEIEPRHLTIIDLEPNDCRYPYGDGPITFCGHPRQDGSSYCTPHFHLTLGFGTASERAATRGVAA